MHQNPVLLSLEEKSLSERMLAMSIRPLGAINYFRNNKRRTIPLLVCCALCVYFIYIFSMYANSSLYMGEYLVEGYKGYSILYPQKDAGDVNELLIQRIMQDESTDGVVECGVSYTSFNMPIGGNYYTKIYRVEKKDIEYMLERLGLGLIAGDLPESGGELLINYRIARSKKLTVGSEMGNQVNEREVLNGKYEVAGILDGEMLLGFIPVNDIKEEPYRVLLVFHKEGRLLQSNEFLERQIKSKDISVVTYKQVKSDMRNEGTSMNSIFNATQVIVVIVMTLAIVNLCYVHFYHRRREFGVLHAVGYSRAQIINRVFGEIAILQCIGFCSGIVLSILTGLAIKYFIFDPKGLPLQVLNSRSLLQTLTIPVFMTAFNIMPIARMLRKLDSISIIQGND